MENYQLTDHFSLYEMVNGQMPALCQDLNWRNIDEEVIFNLKQVALELENVRMHLNTPLTITSGYRCYAWELHQGRKGGSQHTPGLAADVHCSDLDALYNYYKNINWLGGLGDGRRLGFVHIDLRTPDAAQVKKNCGARWNY